LSPEVRYHSNDPIDQAFKKLSKSILQSTVVKFNFNSYLTACMSDEKLELNQSLN